MCRNPRTVAAVVSLALLPCLSACSPQATPSAVPDQAAVVETPAAESDPGAATAAPAADGGSASSRLEPVSECFVELPAEIDPAVKVDCGHVVVPESRQEPGGREVKLGFARFKAITDTAKAPLFMLAGGPGQTNLGANSLPLMAPGVLGSLLAERDVVLLEQRGTEHTDTFLDCPKVYQAPWLAHQQGLDDQATEAFELEALRACIEDFRAKGVNLDAYNSVENAADVDAAREALGYDQIIYYGASYGAQLGQHLMRDFPDALAGVILDGASPLSRKSWIEDRALDAQWGIDNLTELCQADEKCRAAYDIPALVASALKLFDAGPMTFAYSDPQDPTVSVTVNLDKADLAAFIFQQQGSHITAMTLPAMLYQFTQDGGSEVMRQALGTQKAAGLLAAREATKGGEAIVQHLAMVCSDDPVKSTDDLIVEGVSDYAVTFGHAAGDPYAIECGLIGVKELPDSTDVDVRSDVPTLLLAGALDVSTPVFRTKEVADNLPRATMVTFPDGTHVQVAGANFCAIDLLKQFVANPEGQLDLSCVEARPTLPFVLPDGSMSREVE